ncbi:MAG: 30S ribosomal protein S3 [Firmicutes bacterium]|nr:30S ribosomal protein S3 [Bacillota bacterium]
MGQKVHPKGLRIGIIKDWDAKWFADKKEFPSILMEDVKIREFLKKKLYITGVSRIEIERAANRLKVTIYTAKPGMVIGRGGAGVEDIRKQVEALTGKQVALNIVEVKSPETDAQLVAENVAQQLEKRISFRRAMKQAISRAMRLGARGCKVRISGRLGGAEMARRERDVEGTVPLHTLRADIDYGFAEATTTYGKIGIKVWIYKGEVLPAAPRRDKEKPKAAVEGGE